MRLLLLRLSVFHPDCFAYFDVSSKLQGLLHDRRYPSSLPRPRRTYNSDIDQRNSARARQRVRCLFNGRNANTHNGMSEGGDQNPESEFYVVCDRNCLPTFARSNRLKRPNDSSKPPTPDNKNGDKREKREPMRETDKGEAQKPS